MVFKVGDNVMVLDENLSGTIKSISRNLISLETEDGFLLDFNSEELVLNTNETELKSRVFNTDRIKQVLAEKEQPKKHSKKKIKAKDRYEPTMEVDLHIHQLVKSYKGMSNHEILTLQVDTARYKLDWAIKKRIQKLVFIHGVGEGVLKMELDYLFGRYNNIKFYDANYQKYGLGATEIYIYQNAAS